MGADIGAFWIDLDLAIAADPKDGRSLSVVNPDHFLAFNELHHCDFDLGHKIVAVSIPVGSGMIPSVSHQWLIAAPTQSFG